MQRCVWMWKIHMIEGEICLLFIAQYLSSDVDLYSMFVLMHLSIFVTAGLWIYTVRFAVSAGEWIQKVLYVVMREKLQL